MLLAVVFTLVVLVFIYSRWINRLRGLPPGPPPLPFIGNLHQMEEDMDKKFLDWKNKYGKVFTVWMPDPVVVIGDSKILQETIVREGDNFGDRKLPDQFMKLLIGGNYGLVFNYNNIWKEQRRFALHALRDLGFSTSRMQDTIKGYALNIVDIWKASEGQPIDMKDDVMSGVANVIWHLAFGKTLPLDDPLIRRARAAVDKFNEGFGSAVFAFMEFLPFLVDLERKFGTKTKILEAANDEILDIINTEINEVEAAMNVDETPRSYVEAFLQEAKKTETSKDGPGNFTRIQLTGATYDLWFAGFETSVTTIRFFFHYIINNPEVQDKMRAEIDRVVGRREVTLADQKDLHYCNAVIQEVQRLANLLPINFFRQVSNDTNIDGYSIKAGTTILPQFQIVHSDPDQFVRPEFFCPDRHINEKGEYVKDIRVTPFSIGKRACLGEGLARMELFLFLTTWIHHLVFAPVGTIPPPLDYSIGFTRSLTPYKVVIKSRD